MRWLLNSAVITTPGTYVYRLLDREEARAWLLAGGWESRIGYSTTADHIAELCGIRPPLSREASPMQPGDEALVVRLRYRLQDPSSKAGWRPGPGDWEYGLLRRDA